jgi:hypothetical protein
VDRQAKKELMTRLTRDAQRICTRFRLRYRALEPERANVKRRYGVCFSDGTIRIRLIHVTTKKPLKYSSLVNTLCHELAHLRHFNHGPRFQTYYGQILEWARREGIYRPGPDRTTVIGAAEAPGLRALWVSPAARARVRTNPLPPSAPVKPPKPKPAPIGQLELFG